ncbi:hypothetical protein [Hymenobacter edaphi]|uniref:hypothetical protein n=1 Tax=Hymenobacter edaphi TaxID=2211146 RepID=UPI001A9D68A2|nr:hypothetical protein [Hymenobacter edaphi]
MRHDVTISQAASCKTLDTNGHNITVNNGANFNLTGPGKLPALTNKTFLYNKTATSAANLVAAFTLANLGLEVFMYGTWAGDSINKVTSVSIRRIAKPDTTLNFILNDFQEATHYYIDVAGIKDTSLFRLNYDAIDSTFVVYRLYTNWQNKVMLRDKHAAYIGFASPRIFARNQAALSGNCRSYGNIANKALLNTVQKMFGLLIMAAALSPAMPPVAAVVYVATGMIIAIRGPRSTTHDLGQVAAQIASGISPCAEGADDPPRYDDLTPNPLPPISGINPQNGLLWNCPCSWNWTVERSQRSVDFINFPAYDQLLRSSTPTCPGETRGTSGSGVLFQLGKGGSRTIGVRISYFPGCPSSSNYVEYTIYKTFTCR